MVKLAFISKAGLDIGYQGKAILILTDSVYRSREGKKSNTKINLILILIVTFYRCLFSYFEVYFPQMFVYRWDSVFAAFNFLLYYKVREHWQST